MDAVGKFINEVKYGSKSGEELFAEINEADKEIRCIIARELAKLGNEEKASNVKEKIKHILMRLCKDDDEGVRISIAENTRIPEIHALLSSDTSSKVRAKIAENFTDNFAKEYPDKVRKLFEDQNEDIILSLANNGHTPREIQEAIYERLKEGLYKKGYEIAWALAIHTYDLPLLGILAKYGDPGAQRRINEIKEARRKIENGEMPVNEDNTSIPEEALEIAKLVAKEHNLEIRILDSVARLVPHGSTHTLNDQKIMILETDDGEVDIVSLDEETNLSRNLASLLESRGCKIEKANDKEIAVSGAISLKRYVC